MYQGQEKTTTKANEVYIVVYGRGGSTAEPDSDRDGLVVNELTNWLSLSLDTATDYALYGSCLLIIGISDRKSVV